MSNIETEVAIDWMACELIEAVPGKVSGRPVVLGTRILPDAILNSYELGDSIEDIHEGFPTLSLNQIKRLIDFGLDQLKQRGA
ncbi:MAG: DUF433 domain-containing protein [Terracidiphilus sp.]|jgi:uncharacterized protein (DUF433 family)